ncbi:type II secretion system protein [Neobacillus drentensis]|uniref:type IV pilus modification PilV family protein n=1 Tax=Neobacillus drentensis TaxID=220684 RepID=UPI002FFEDCA5
MEILKNEKGLTLIEVVVSIVILSIVLISLMSIFPQMSLLNNQNEQKTQAINTAKEVLINWKESQVVKTFLQSSNQTTGFTPAYVDENINYTLFSLTKFTNYYYFETTKDEYKVQIKIKRTPDNNSNNSFVNQIDVQLFNSKGNMVAETYGYVIR